MENETREIVYLSVSLILISIVLSFLVYGLGLTSKMSQVRTSDAIAKDRIEDFREYNAYDCQTIIGDEAIELIRQEYKSGVTVFVDFRENTANSKIVEEGTNDYCSYCSSKGGDHRIYNDEHWLWHREAPDSVNYFFLSTSAITDERNDMRNWFCSDDKYRAYLVYNSEDPVLFYEKLMDDYYDLGITKENGYSEDELLIALDSCVGPSDPTAKVTGIILISYETLGLEA